MSGSSVSIDIDHLQVTTNKNNIATLKALFCIPRMMIYIDDRVVEAQVLDIEARYGTFVPHGIQHFGIEVFHTSYRACISLFVQQALTGCRWTNVVRRRRKLYEFFAHWRTDDWPY